MGQYYRCTICAEDGSNKRVLDPHQHDDNGYKLLEHSYYYNRFVEAVCGILARSPARVWWVGDYAENYDIPEEYRKFEPLVAHSEDAETTVINLSFDFDAHTYLINESTHEYIDLLVLKEKNTVKNWGTHIHPLPLLTAVGNGRGGGDYHSGSNMNSIGMWAGDVLRISKDIPPLDAFLAYIEITPDAVFIETDFGNR